MILHKLYSGGEVRLVKLIGYVPPNRAELSPFLHCAMQECHGIQHGFPLRHARDIQAILRQKAVRSFETRLDAQWWLGRVFQRALQKVDREAWVGFRGNPAAEIIMDSIGGDQDVKELVHVVKPQVTVLEKHPVTLSH